MGNGHDTLFLAHLVGQEGKVYAYDVQPKALENTRKLLTEHQVLGRAKLRLQSHSEMQHQPGSIALVAFNFGYLPGSDKRITTEAPSSLRAIEAALEVVSVGGLIIVVIYSGHEQGKREKA